MSISTPGTFDEFQSRFAGMVALTRRGGDWKTTFTGVAPRMSLVRFTPGGAGEKEVIDGMKAGSTLYVEVTLFNTKGVGQVAEFDLRGLTKTYNQCPTFWSGQSRSRPQF